MTAAFGAVAPGTDLGLHARALRRTHDAVLSGVRPPERPRPVVARSWGRVLGMGLQPDSFNGRADPNLVEVERRRTESPLSLVIDDVRGVLSSVADAAHFLVVVTDADGVVLWREGAPRVRMTADRLGFTEGAVWTERHVGTNAIGTALAEEAPVELFSAEHFENQQHPWYCTAAPLHDPRTGDLLGVVDVSGPALTLHPAIGALVESSTRIAEAALWRQHVGQLEQLRRSAEHLIGSGPALVVDDHGWVAHRVGVSVRHRIAAPRAGVAVAVPGLGACMPEQIRGGWLVRLSPTSAAIRARLEGCTLTVEADGGRWTVGLTPRQADVMRLLAGAGQSGLTAAALSTALFGDRDHQVTARAEVSRLRRVVGALVATNPYRIASGAALEIQ